MLKLGINFDEISDDLDVALDFMASNGITRGELRTINKRNFVYWTNEEARQFKRRIDEEGIELIAAATPLFKWYVNEKDSDVPHDNFGFDPRLSTVDKYAIIKRTFELARILGIPRLRIFSGLGKCERAGRVFAADPLLDYALGLAGQYAIDLYLENEPVCRVHSSIDVVQFLDAKQHPRLKLWLDIANLIEIGESIDMPFLRSIESRLGYLHVKDYRQDGGGQRIYVPAGEGTINYRDILGLISRIAAHDLVLTIETHAPPSNKVEYSQKSVQNVRAMLAELEIRA